MKHVLITAMGLALIGCSDNTTSKIDPGSLPPVIFDNKPIKINASALNKSGKKLPEIPISYQSNPTGVLDISGDGQLRCLTSGDATILLNGGGQSALTNVKCRQVARIEVPKEAVFIIGKELPELKPTIFDEKGNAIAEAGIDAKAANVNIIRVENGLLVPIQVGKTYITYTAGNITTTMDVAVAKLINELSGPIIIPDGGVKAMTLSKGSYAFEVKVTPEGGGMGEGVAINSTGASCSQPEKSQHMFKCDISDTATISISNPTAFGMGAAMTGFVSVIELPSI